jgi:hypothetical protein
MRLGLLVSLQLTTGDATGTIHPRFFQRVVDRSTGEPLAYGIPSATTLDEGGKGGGTVVPTATIILVLQRNPTKMREATPALIYYVSWTLRPHASTVNLSDHRK